jgi:molecular chaperone DnaK (HSP70)
MLDASRIAGLNCVKLVNDTTAIGTAYGLYNADLPAPEQPPKIVSFVSVGYTSTQVAICAFNKGKMKMLATASDPCLGGRDFDFVIFRKLSEEFEAKYRMKIEDSPKATVRLLQECEKLKKNMSANTQELPINIDCLLNDRDLCSKMKRDDFEEYSTDLLTRFEGVLQRCLALAKLKPSDIQVVELVGGSSRVPALKRIVSSVFKQEGRMTLNADEAVARGCALQAAICSPAYKVREFSVTEACPYSITLQWDKDDSGDQNMTDAAENDGVTVAGKDTSLEVFPLLHPIPCSRRLFFNRCGPFTLEARYTYPEELPSQNAVIGTFKVSNVPHKSGEISKIRVKVRMNAHGIFSVSQAEVAEEYEKEVEMEVPDDSVKPASVKDVTPPEDKPMEVETPSNGDASVDVKANTPGPEGQVPNEKSASKKPAMKKVMVKKKAIKYNDLPVEANIMQYSTKQLNDFCEVEGKLFEQDELEHKRSHAKNAVEEYVYEMRGKIQDSLSHFAVPKEAENLVRMLDETEDWLYGDGEDLQRQAYVDRLNQLKSLGNPIELRSFEYHNRPHAVENFEKSIVHIRKVLDSVAAGEETYNHLSPDQLHRLQATLDEQEGWLREQINIQNSLAKTDDPTLRCSDIASHQQVMESTCLPIINTPKPAPPPPPQTNDANQNETNSAKDAKSPAGVGKKVKPTRTTQTAEKSENMDVD